MIRRIKGLQLTKVFFITHLNTFGSKMFLHLKFMNFENVTLTKKNTYLITLGLNCLFKTLDNLVDGMNSTWWLFDLTSL
jgi:hypothetical protein